MDGTHLKFGLHDSVGHHVSRTARIIERRVEADLRKFGFTRVGWCVLLAVAEEGKKNPSDIADFVGIDRTATSRALRVLETDGLIAREMGRDDRRTTEVRLTELGEAQFRAALPTCREAMQHFHGKLSLDELMTLKALLTRLSAGELPPSD
ncbi:MarR family winged helix-turn-helix transcriptional regulator [Roseicyclus persicicus]|uniref:MarR family transcriptional regulator n=1 Tax=Roseicyclus persicicus TaxID=2650661 RepID=A0A7X6JVU0_9RHOB|nr:MarR family transcriptional regulator [Roseibacterium persicicum]NKX43707.1 MarR family transcriptional regulator [Roseibacterium persicicum]